MAFQLRAIDIPAESLGAVVLGCAAGRWAHFATDMPADAEFVNLMPVPTENKDDAQTLRLFFFHDSFPESETLEAVPAAEADISMADEEEPK